MEAEVPRMQGRKPRNAEQPLEPEKGKETDSHLELPEGMPPG